jgi:hypothetical protein
VATCCVFEQVSQACSDPQIRPQRAQLRNWLAVWRSGTRLAARNNAQAKHFHFAIEGYRSVSALGKLIPGESRNTSDAELTITSTAQEAGQRTPGLAVELWGTDGQLRKDAS